MVLRNERQHEVITVLDASGAGVTGLTDADFTMVAYGRGYGASVWSTFDADMEIVELDRDGDYAASFLTPPSAGWRNQTIYPVNPAYTVWSSRWSGEVEANDLDTVQLSLSLGTAPSPGQNLLLGWTYSGLQLVVYRYNRWVLPVVDSAGVAVDLPSLYSNLKLSVRTQDQTTRKLDAEDGTPTGFVLQSSLGQLTIEWPESLGTLGSVSDIYAHLPAGALTAPSPVYIEVTGDLGGDAAKTVPILRSSPLDLTRREVGT